MNKENTIKCEATTEQHAEPNWEALFQDERSVNCRLSEKIRNQEAIIDALADKVVRADSLISCLKYEIKTSKENK